MICQVALLPVRGLELATSGSATQASVTWAMADHRERGSERHSRRFKESKRLREIQRGSETFKVAQRQRDSERLRETLRQIHISYNGQCVCLS